MDVGQGDGIFIRTPGGKNILIDAGQDSRRGVLPFLRSRGIKTVDVLLLTHPHADHISGAVSPREDREGTVNSVLEFCAVREVLDSGKEHTLDEYKKLLEMISERGIPYRQPRAGDMLKWDPALAVKVLHPDRPDYDNINDNSIVVRLAYGDISFLFTGDAEEMAEERILESFRSELRTDVLKVGHHGSRSSSKPPFLDAVQPRYALISCGYENKFDHPRHETLENLEAVDAKILRTDIDGFLIFKTDGKKIRWQRNPIPFPETPFDPGAAAQMSSKEWAGKGMPEEGAIRITAEERENLWAGVATAPRWTRPMPAEQSWSCAASLTTSDERKTEAGLLIWGDNENFILFGIQEGRMASLTVVRKGVVALGPELVVARPSKLGFRKTAAGLDAVLYDDEKGKWREIWKLSKEEIPLLPESARLGFYVKSWGYRSATAAFKDYRFKSKD